jgi:hypothetical protein
VNSRPEKSLALESRSKGRRVKRSPHRVIWVSSPDRRLGYVEDARISRGGGRRFSQQGEALRVFLVLQTEL